jgi:hypothetical protein
MSEYVTIVNRTEEPITGTWDSKSFVLTPGKHEFTLEKAERFKAQHPVMGSENPQTGDVVYKLGIVEYHDPVTPLSPEFLAGFKGSVEKWDRTKLTGARPSEVVAGDNGLYGMNDWRRGQPLSSSFVKPD